MLLLLLGSRFSINNLYDSPCMLIWIGHAMFQRLYYLGKVLCIQLTESSYEFTVCHSCDCWLYTCCILVDLAGPGFVHHWPLCGVSTLEPRWDPPASVWLTHRHDGCVIHSYRSMWTVRCVCVWSVGRSSHYQICMLSFKHRSLWVWLLPRCMLSYKAPWSLGMVTAKMYVIL